MLVDLHAHVHFNIFKNDVDEVIRRAREAGVFMIAPSTKLSTSQKAVEFAEKYKGLIFAAVGLHPLYTKPTQHDPDEDPRRQKHFRDTSLRIQSRAAKY